MRIENGVIRYGDESIRAFQGTDGDKMINVKPLESVIKIGQAVFPIKPTGKLSGVLDRIASVIENKLCISLNGFWHTLNTVSVVVPKNTGENQQAFFTIQHGTQSKIVFNGDDDTVTFVHEKGLPLVVTGSNLSTGAVGFTRTYPTTGQAYKLHSNSTQHVEGELKTVGGELVSGGELKEVCVQEVYQVTDTTPKKEWSGELQSVISITSTAGYPSEQELNNVLAQFYLDVLAGTNTSGNASSASNIIQAYEQAQQYALSPAYYYHIDSATNTQVPVTEQFTPTISGEYTIVFDLSDFGGELKTLTSKNPAAKFTLEAGKVYSGVYKIDYQQPQAKTFNVSKASDNTWAGSIQVKFVSKVSYTIYGPLEKFCANSQIIDTRFSYTTPILTTDTRRTISRIELDLEPIN